MDWKVILAVVALAALGVVVLWLVRSNSGPNVSRSPELRDARKHLVAAEKRFQKGLSEAQRDLTKAEKTYEKRVKAARKEVTAAETHGDTPVTTFLGSQGKVTVYPTYLKVREGEIPLDPSVEASVDTGAQLAQLRPLVMVKTPEGAALLGVSGALFGTIPNRMNPAQASDWCLLVGNEKMASLTILKPEQVDLARRTAAKINALSYEAENFEEEQAKRIAEARHHLDRVEDDQTEIEVAKAALLEAEANTTEVEEARAAMQLFDAEEEGDVTA